MDIKEACRAPWHLAVSFGLLLAAIQPAVAQNIPGYPESIEAYDHREVAMLPPYCVNTMFFRDRIPGHNNPEQLQHWRAIMGNRNFDTLHHYCWGLMDTNRATILAQDMYTRRHYFSVAISEFDYVLNNAAEDFFLRPEVLTKKGENLVHLGRGPAAMLAFERAVKIKPDYWPAYAQMSDYYKASGDIKRAKELLEEGLSSAPEAAALKRRLAELNSTPEKKAATGRGAARP